jgi:hypothetical protein
MAIKKTTVVAALRDASTQILALSDENSILRSEKEELLSKVASLESSIDDRKVGSPLVHDFLGKEAADTGSNQYLGFGSVGNPETGAPITATEKMDMILNGEYIG